MNSCLSAPIRAILRLFPLPAASRRRDSHRSPLPDNRYSKAGFSSQAITPSSRFPCLGSLSPKARLVAVQRLNNGVAHLACADLLLTRLNDIRGAQPLLQHFLDSVFKLVRFLN